MPAWHPMYRHSPNGRSRIRAARLFVVVKQCLMSIAPGGTVVAIPPGNTQQRRHIMDETLRDELDESLMQENGSAGALFGFLLAAFGLAVLVIA